MEARVEMNTCYVVNDKSSCPVAGGITVLLEHCGGDGGDGNNSNVVMTTIM
jgi:hypothetical protein